jgi:copper resistance protein C
MRHLLLAAFLGAAAAALPAPALGHAELVSSTPADGDVLREPPAEVVITFDAELRPEGSEFRVTGPGGEAGMGSLDLDVAERNVLRGAVSASQPGTYAVTWTVLGEDGHQETGTFDFTVGGVPETALRTAPEPMRLALTLAGGILIGAGAVASRRRAGR